MEEDIKSGLNPQQETIPGIIEARMDEDKARKREVFLANLARGKQEAKERRMATVIKDTPPDNPRDSYRAAPPKRTATEPWRPASVLLVNNKEAGYRYRWVRKDLLEKRIAEGWDPVFSKENARVQTPEQTLIDGQPMSSFKQRRNLILCKMPEELAKSREDYYARLSAQSKTSPQKEFEQNTTLGGESLGYGKVEVGK